MYYKLKTIESFPLLYPGKLLRRDRSDMFRYHLVIKGHLHIFSSLPVSYFLSYSHFIGFMVDVATAGL